MFKKVFKTNSGPFEFCKIFKNTFLTEHLWTTAAVSYINKMLSQRIPSWLREIYWMWFSNDGSLHFENAFPKTAGKGYKLQELKKFWKWKLSRSVTFWIKMHHIAETRTLFWRAFLVMLKQYNCQSVQSRNICTWKQYTVMNKIFSIILMQWTEFLNKHIQGRTEVNKRQHIRQTISCVQFLRKKQRSVIQYHCCNLYPKETILQKKLIWSVNFELASLLDVRKVWKGQSMNGKGILKIVWFLYIRNLAKSR